MDAKLIEKARAVMKRAAVTREAELCGETCKGITVDDVLRIFPGARVLPAEEAKALKMQQAEGAESA